MVACATLCSRLLVRAGFVGGELSGYDEGYHDHKYEDQTREQVAQSFAQRIEEHANATDADADAGAENSLRVGSDFAMAFIGQRKEHFWQIGRVNRLYRKPAGRAKVLLSRPVCVDEAPAVEVNRVEEAVILLGGRLS